jgi:hypothetical protein
VAAARLKEWRSGSRRWLLCVLVVVGSAAALAWALKWADHRAAADAPIPSLAGPAAPSTTTTTTSTSTTTTSTTGAVAPTAGAAVVSAEFVVGGVPTVVAGWSFHTAGGATIGGRIDVLQRSASWRTVASFPEGIYDRPGASKVIEVHDVTGDGRLDVLFPIMSASDAPYVVVSDDSGVWRLVGFGQPDRPYALNPDEPDGDGLVTTSNLCTPTCAAGHVRRQRWRYAADRQVFVEVAAADCDSTGSGAWRCEPSDSPLQLARPLQVSR